jgi:hypothetical protein
LKCGTKPIWGSRAGGAATDAIMQNKPNLPGAPGNGRGWPELEGPGEGDYAERTPIPAVAAVERPPLFHYSIIPPFRSAANRAKRSQFRGVRASPEAELCETKPNLGRMGHLGDGMPGRGRWCETKPIWPVGPDLGGRIVQDKPNFPQMERARESPAPPFGPPAFGLRRSVVQTNPIGPRQAEKTIAKARGLDAATRHIGKRAKQTQFAPGPCGGQVVYGQRVMVYCTCTGFRQNKANFRRSLKSQV